MLFAVSLSAICLMSHYTIEDDVRFRAQDYEDETDLEQFLLRGSLVLHE